jgi:hypothetical protein
VCNLPGFGGGGPSSQEQGIQAQTESLNNLLQANYSRTFGQSEQALSRLQTELNLIQSGQTGPGMGAEELSARRSDIVNQAAAEARNVQQQVQDRGAGQVFAGSQDASGLARTTGIQRELGEQASSAAERDKANALINLKAQDYALGRTQAAQTVGGLEALSGAYRGLAGESQSGALQAGQSAFGEASQINKENLQKGSLLGGLLKTGLGLGTSFVTGGLSNLGGADTSFGENVGEFFKGGLSSLSNG